MQPSHMHKLPGCAYGNTPLQDSIANHAAIPHAQALSTNELPIVQLSELANGPHTPAPTLPSASVAEQFMMTSTSTSQLLVH